MKFGKFLERKTLLFDCSVRSGLNGTEDSC